jgi:hypothetical protein
MWSMRALTTGGDALALSGRRDEAVKWWTSALRMVPRSIGLRPSEQAAVAGLRLRLGDRAGAQPLISTLATVGYRHPAYVAALKTWGAKR